MILFGQGSYSRNERSENHYKLQTEGKSCITQPFAVERFAFSSSFLCALVMEMYFGEGQAPKMLLSFFLLGICPRIWPRIWPQIWPWICPWIWPVFVVFCQFKDFRTSIIVQFDPDLARIWPQMRCETQLKTEPTMFVDVQKHVLASLPRTSYCL